MRASLLTDCRIERKNKFKFACVNRHQVNNDMDYYRDVKTALNSFKPEIVVVSVSDGEHAKILPQICWLSWVYYLRKTTP